MSNDVQRGLKAGFPIFIGYIAPAIAFGILSKGCGITLLECFLFSAVVFAGASQFIALNLLITGMGPAGIIFTTLLVNFRHFLMSAYLSTRISKRAKKYIPLIAFGVTDETFSVMSFTKGSLSTTFVLILEISAYSAWVSGTVAGYILGRFIPQNLSQSMGVALYALLLAILLPEIKTSTKSLLLAIFSGILNIILIQFDILPDGWSIIVCILVIAAAGSFFITDKELRQKS